MSAGGSHGQHHGSHRPTYVHRNRQSHKRHTHAIA
jgi:hypothetical protein